MLKHLSKVRIEFNPFDRRSTCALEFLAQCNSHKARASNPKCEVSIKRRTDDAAPSIKVTFLNGKEETLDGASMPAQAIRKRILEQAQEMETAAMFKEAGLEWPVMIPEEEALQYSSKKGKSR